MFAVTEPDGVRELSFDQLNKLCGETLDEAFFSEAFTTHIIEYDGKKIVVSGGSI